MFQRQEEPADNERTIQMLQRRFADEVRAATRSHGTTWHEACEELTGLGFVPRMAMDMVRGGFEGVSWDVEAFRIERYPAGAGTVLLPRGLATRLERYANELRSRADVVLRHPSGTAEEEEAAR